MDRLWEMCGDSEFILNVEDDWVYNNMSARGVISQSINILRKHNDVLEVLLRKVALAYRFEPM